MRRYLLLLSLCAPLLVSACSSDAGNAADEDATGSDGTDGTEATDGTDGTEGSDGTDGVDGTTGVIPECNFKPPTGAQCNPYPDCPGTGCPSGEICTLVANDGATRIDCQAPGTALAGQACDAENGPQCADGLCYQGACRTFCVASQQCTNAACQPTTGIPGKPTVCGLPSDGCDILENSGCQAGMACYLTVGDIPQCLQIQGNGMQNNECSGQEDCAPGFQCRSVDNQMICAQLCAQSEEHPKACATVCTGEGITSTKISEELGACVPGGEVDPPPPPPSCDALVQDCEGAAQACYPTSQGEVCLQKGNTAPGGSCQSVNDCEQGSTCVASKCYRICDPTDSLNGMCETGLNAKCSAPNGAHTGYCDE